MVKYSTLALSLIDDADRLLQEVEPFSFNAWKRAAYEWGTTIQESKYYGTQARTLLTIWGGPVLNDYANRMWADLLKCYYKGRWQRFFHAVMEASRAGIPFDEVAFGKDLSDNYEQLWCYGNPCIDIYDVVECHANDIAKRILRKIDEGQYSVPNRAAEVLGEYMRHYPAAQLQDVYKLCFQDVYGPGHIIRDSATCRQAIVDEIEQMDVTDPRFPDFEYTGVEGNYVRVNLRVIKDNRVPLDLFVRLLMESANTKQKMPLYDWKGQWARLQKVLDTVTPRPNHFEADAVNLQAWLDRGEVMVHHSSRFNEQYAPHYRIIRHDLFEKDLLPLIFTP